jgi:hypothetical protein
MAGQNAIREPVIVRKKEHFAVPFPVILTSGQATEAVRNDIDKGEDRGASSCNRNEDPRSRTV